MNTLTRANEAQLIRTQGRYSEAYGDSAGLAIGALIRTTLAVARRNIVAIALILAASVALAVAMTMLDTPRYTATTTVQINDQSDSVLGDDLETQSTANSSWDVDRFLNTQLSILQSRGVAQRVANRLNLYDDPAFYAAMEMEPPQGNLARDVREKIVVGLLRGNMNSNLPRETRIAQINFTSTDPAYSARIANAFAEEFIQSSLQRRYDSSSYAREFISDQLEEARARLEASEREVNAYAREAGLIRSRTSDDEGSGSASSVTVDSLSQLTEAANLARAQRVAAESRWRIESAKPLLTSGAVQASPTVQQLLQRRSELAARLETLRGRYLDDYPEIVQLQNELDAVDRQLTEVANTIRNGVRSDYEAALQTESNLRNQVAALQADTLAEQDRSVRYNTLAREADTNRSLYDGLLQRFRELNASAGIATSNLAIIDRAEIPSVPTSPNLISNLLVALLAGIVLAAAYVFLREQLDDAIRVPEDIEAKVEMPLLGVIPAATGDDPAGDLSDPKSPISEAYNSLRGQLLYSTADGLPRILLVTSSQPSEGKTTTSTAIATGLARMGKRVVLIDADLRRPSAHKRYGLTNRHGLSGLLTGADTLSPETVHGVGDNLAVITSGPIPPSPTELLTGPRLAALLEELSARYDCVILDSPPILGLADAPVLSALADGVVFVIESDRARGGMLKTAIRRLRAMNPVILGAVLTKFDPQKGSNRYSEYYGYEYYRYSSTDHAEA
ncbi:GumC family protein [Croceicoccus bisphenolivorans]|uniref:GumC family protein n=1 Tax=Croceicoccus bisphenolivorans TaxID=1783232 RepID=UPI0009EF1FA2|nr:polysaccharide biosynthesis tyrosine autokinase [Croceicoccus bisphenolivorans]